MSMEKDSKPLSQGDEIPCDTYESENLYDDSTYMNEDAQRIANRPEVKSDSVVDINFEAIPGCSGAIKMSGPRIAEAMDRQESEEVQSAMDSEIIDLDTYIFTNSALEKKRKDKRKKRRMIRSSSDSEQADIERTNYGELPDVKPIRLSEAQKGRLNKEMLGLENEHVAHVNVKVQSWIDRLEYIRKSTTNMKGESKGEMKVLLLLLKKSTEVLTLRASTAGDPVFLESKVKELVKENSDLKTKVNTLEKLIRKSGRNNDLNRFSVLGSDDEDHLMSRQISPPLCEDVYVPEVDVNIPPVFRPPLRGERALLDKGGYMGESCNKKRNMNFKEIDSNNKNNDTNKKNDINSKLLFSVNRLTTNLESMMQQMNSFSERLYTLEVSSLAQDTSGKRNDTQIDNKDVGKDRERNKDNVVHYKRQSYVGTKRNYTTNRVLNKRKKTPYVEVSEYDSRIGTDEGSNMNKELNYHQKEGNRINYDNSNYYRQNPRKYDSDEAHGMLTESELAETQYDSGRVDTRDRPMESVSWANVVGRKRKKTGVIKKDVPTVVAKSKQASEILKKRIPRTAAVSMICTKDDYDYSSAMKRAKTEIKLESCGINEVSIKRSIAGGIIFEIPGDNASDKALLLESKMRQLFGGTGVVITRPVKKVDIKLSGLEESTNINDIILEIVNFTGCNTIDVKCSSIRTVRNGLCVAWIQCPIDAAQKLAEAKTIGWASARIEILKSRPLQCFKCLAPGHPYQRCPSDKDRRQCCFRCGEVGHFAINCKNRVKCPVCTDARREANHRAGSSACRPIPPRGFSPINKEVIKNTDKNISETIRMEDNSYISDKRDRRPDNSGMDTDGGNNG